MASKTYQILDGARYPGRCVRCQREARNYEAVLLRDDSGKYAVAHESCAGVRMKSKVGGGRVRVSGPDTMAI